MFNNTQYAQYSDRISCTLLRLTRELVELDGWTFRRRLVAYVEWHVIDGEDIGIESDTVTVPDQLADPEFASRCHEFPIIRSDGSITLACEERTDEFAHVPEAFRGRGVRRRSSAPEPWNPDPLWPLNEDEPWWEYESYVRVFPLEGEMFALARSQLFGRIDRGGMTIVRQLGEDLDGAAYQNYREAKQRRLESRILMEI